MKLNSPPMILQGCLLVLGLYLFMVFGKSILVSDSQFNILAGHAILQGNHDLRPFLDFDALQKVNDALLGNVIKLHSNDNPIASWWLSYPQFPLYLNLPFVWALERVGLSPVAGIPPMWSAMQENLMQVLIASGLMAIYGAVLMLIALRWMATRHAILVAVVMVLGTSISSNLSRAIWTDTWAVLFIMLAIAHLADAQKRKASFNALIMVTLLSFAFFCKPVYAVSVITAVVWAWWIDRRNTLIMCLLGMVYALLFYAWQQRSFSYGLMSNYQFNSYFFGFKLEYLMGLLVSPQPGIFIFWAWLLPLFALIFGRWQYFTPVEKRLILLSLMPLLAMLGMACHSPFWHGTYGYGPRILAQALPWLSLMVVIATAHFLSTEANTAKDLSPSYDKSTGYWVFSARFKGFTAILVFWSVLINVYGTTQSKIMGWHVVSLTSLSLADRPTSLLDPRHQKVFWNWQDPVFLAGIVHPERYYSISIQEAKDKRLK